MQQKTTKKDLVYLNKPTQQVYKEHVANTQINDVTEVEAKSKYLTKEQIEQIIVLNMYGASNVRLAGYFNIPSGTISHTTQRDSYRRLQLSFQISKQKRLGKMVFTYDKEVVQAIFDNLPQEMKQLVTVVDGEYVLDESKLVVKTKILKSEIIL